MTRFAAAPLFCLSLVLAGCMTRPYAEPSEPDVSSWEMYGEAESADLGVGYDAVEPAVPVAALLEDPLDYAGQTVRVAGEVTQVCQAKGCWIRLGGREDVEAADAQTVFVKFTCPVEDRLIPKDAVGRQAVVRGTIKVEQIDEAMARHLAEDAGKTPEEVASINGPQQMIRIDSPAAAIAAE